MFKLCRFYSITSFIIIFIAAALIVLFYRQMTIQWITNVTEKDHLVLAQTTLNSVKPQLAAYLEDTAPEAVRSELATALRRLMRNNSMSRINVYDRNGALAFSTDAFSGAPGQTHAARAKIPEVTAAISGSASSHVEYRDMFNRMLGTTPDDNLMKTFVPIRETSGGPALGVFEINSDVSPMVIKNERMFTILLLGSEFILALLYGVLLLVVQRERNISEAQQNDIQEQMTNLEVLSRQLLNSDELHKKKIAFDLHEGLAQTLAAIKINAESSRQNLDAGAAPLESLVPVLQHAIHEVRNIATELRPPSLDDFGLMSAINGYCREFQQKNPEIRVEQEHSIRGEKVPEPLKIIIYRIIKSTFDSIAFGSNTDRIRLALQRTDDAVTLTISDVPTEHFSAADVLAQDFNPRQRFSEMHDRTVISGGVFTAKHGKANEVTLRSSWAC